jgi:peptidyl-prolyl cis-trans isomerase SurA
MLKRIVLVALTTVLFNVFSWGQDNPVILTVNGEEIRKDEFIYTYTKNDKNAKFDRASLDDYMKLFVNYKLKVAEARDLGYDTIPELQRELAGYKAKSAEKYLTDSEVNEKLVREAYERKKYEIKASHILFTGKNAYNQAIVARKEIMDGADFEEIARKKSQDPSVVDNGGSLGYFSAFQMVYAFEEAAYNMKIGEVSEPVKTQFGYHLLKVYDRRENPGRIQVAHIYAKVPKEGSEKEIKDAEDKINEIYQLLKNQKGSFEELAKQYSDDNTSNQKGGELAPFTSGRMVPEFESVAFALKNDGDISEPFRTSYGWHIVKKLNQEPIGTFESMKAELESKIQKGEGNNKSKELFVEKLKKKYRFRNKAKRWIKDSYNEEAKGRLNVDDNKKAFTYKKEKGFFKKKTIVTAGEFKEYLVSANPKSNIDIKDFYKDFVTNYFLDYEKSMLYTNYPEYKALMQEFSDGIILFAIANDKLWKKSSEDTTGLKEYFKTNQSNYQWTKRLDVEIYSSAKINIIKEAIAMAKDSTKTAQEILTYSNKESQLNMNVEKGKYEISKKEILQKFTLQVGVSDFILDDGKFIFVRVFEVMEPHAKELRDTRGAAISDYQNYLELEWIRNLKATYPVVINQDALNALIK